MLCFLVCIPLIVCPNKAEAALLETITNVPGDLLPVTTVDGLLPDLDVKTPAVTVDTPILDVSVPKLKVTVKPDQQQPILQLPDITAKINTELSGSISTGITARITTVIPAKIELPTVPASEKPEIPAVPDVQTEHREPTPVAESVPTAEPMPESISTEAPVASLVPAAAQVPAVFVRTEVVPAGHEPTLPRAVPAKPYRKDMKVVASHSLPSRSDPQNREFTPLSTAVTSSAPTRTASTNIPGSGVDSANAGLLFPNFRLQPPKTMDIEYVRSQHFGFHQWSKPPPTEPPRYTLLLN